MSKRRVVVTGMGVIAPNALGVADFKQALQEGRSGVRFVEESSELNFRCQIGGVPPIDKTYLEQHLPVFYVEKIENKGVLYGCLAGAEAWQMAGFEINPPSRNKKAGMILGSGALGMDGTSQRLFELIDSGNNRRLGSRSIPQSMNSGAAAYLNQLLRLGHSVMSNSSACITGSEAILMGYHQVASGQANVMVCGSTEGDGRYMWAGFDAMRVLCIDSNNDPEKGSRPMSESSAGFVPSGGAGALVLESLESAKERGATIYAEILGGAQNSGAMLDGGTMTAPNAKAAIECIEMALSNAGVEGGEIDLISGHLTSTKADPLEVQNWLTALGGGAEKFPLINTPKSMIGHTISAAGSIESVACVLQLNEGFIHRNINLTEESIHPQIKELIPTDKIPLETKHQEIKTIIKSNFGFGDLNCCLVFNKYEG